MNVIMCSHVKNLFHDGLFILDFDGHAQHERGLFCHAIGYLITRVSQYVKGS